MIVGLLPSGYPPYLLDRIQVGRVWRKRNKGHPVTDILVLWFCLDEPFCLLVPGGIVQDEDDPLSFTWIALADELPETFDGRLPVEPQWLRDEEPPVRRCHEPAVGCVLLSGIRLHPGLAALRRPCTGDCALDAEMHLVLENNDVRPIRIQGLDFF